LSSELFGANADGHVKYHDQNWTNRKHDHIDQEIYDEGDYCGSLGQSQIINNREYKHDDIEHELIAKDEAEVVLA